VQLRQLERPYFFTGKLLTAEDLQREQEYQRNKVRLHNRFLHGWGVVAGLRVSLDRGAVVVAPGLALDCAGNELVLPCEERISLSTLAGRRYVTIRYIELPIGQIPSPSGEIEPSHFQEAVAVELSSGSPLAGPSGLHAGRPGCGTSHPLCLAILSQRGSRWRITPVQASTRCRRVTRGAQ
jgi:hypothetical protein